MRLWSINPTYLDTKGIVALWRESLLAQKVLEGKTIGYKNHSQLIRFKEEKNPLIYIGCYLSHVYEESRKRGYNFDKSKILHFSLEVGLLKVTTKQIEYEMTHLLKKLKNRDLEKYKEVSKIRNISAHPIFEIIEGDIQDWERP